MKFSLYKSEETTRKRFSYRPETGNSTEGSSHVTRFNYSTRLALTGVVEGGGSKGAVFKIRVCRPDVLKITVLKERVLELYRLHHDADKPARERA